MVTLGLHNNIAEIVLLLNFYHNMVKSLAKGVVDERQSHPYPNQGILTLQRAKDPDPPQVTPKETDELGATPHQQLPSFKNHGLHGAREGKRHQHSSQGRRATDMP